MILFDPVLQSYLQQVSFLLQQLLVFSVLQILLYENYHQKLEVLIQSQNWLSGVALLNDNTTKTILPLQLAADTYCLIDFKGIAFLLFSVVDKANTAGLEMEVDKPKIVDAHNFIKQTDNIIICICFKKLLSHSTGFVLQQSAF